MNAITFYQPSGEVYSVLTGDSPVIEDTIKISELPWVEGVWDGATHYVLDGAAVERQPCPATLTGMTLHNMPAPCKIVINSTEYEVTDKTVELEFDYPGVYKIKVLAFPYLDAEFEIET